MTNLVIAAAHTPLFWTQKVWRGFLLQMRKNSFVFEQMWSKFDIKTSSLKSISKPDFMGNCVSERVEPDKIQFLQLCPQPFPLCRFSHHEVLCSVTTALCSSVNNSCFQKKSTQLFASTFPPSELFDTGCVSTTFSLYCCTELNVLHMFTSKISPKTENLWAH